MVGPQCEHARHLSPCGTQAPLSALCSRLSSHLFPLERLGVDALPVSHRRKQPRHPDGTLVGGAGVPSLLRVVWMPSGYRGCPGSPGAGCSSAWRELLALLFLPSCFAVFLLLSSPSVSVKTPLSALPALSDLHPSGWSVSGLFLFFFSVHLSNN